MRFHSKNIAGFSLLEFSASMILILPLLLGAIDVFNLLRTRAALREGAKLAGRELSAIDGMGIAIDDSAAPMLSYSWQLIRHDAENPSTVTTLLLGNSVNRPSACFALQGGAYCRRAVSSASASPVKALSFDYDKVLQGFATREIKALLPRARFDCNASCAARRNDPSAELETNCACLYAEPATYLRPQGEEQGAPLQTAGLDFNAVRVRIEYALPLFGYSLFSGSLNSKSITLSVQETQRIEHELLNTESFVHVAPFTKKTGGSG